MNLRQAIDCTEYLGQTCNCGISVGDPVTVDGLTSRGTVVRRNGRRLVIQVQDWRGSAGFRNGYRIERDQSFVHKLGKGTGE